MLKLPVVKVYALETNKMSALIRFLWKYGCYIWLEDKMCCILKLQIDRDF